MPNHTAPVRRTVPQHMSRAGRPVQKAHFALGSFDGGCLPCRMPSRKFQVHRTDPGESSKELSGLNTYRGRRAQRETTQTGGLECPLRKAFSSASDIPFPARSCREVDWLATAAFGLSWQWVDFPIPQQPQDRQLHPTAPDPRRSRSERVSRGRPASGSSRWDRRRRTGWRGTRRRWRSDTGGAWNRGPPRRVSPRRGSAW